MELVINTFAKYIEKKWWEISAVTSINELDMSILDKRKFYREMALSILDPGGLNARFWELYVLKAWTSEHLDTLIYKITSNQQVTDILSSHWTSCIFDYLKRIKRRNPSSVWVDHYDIPVSLYKSMLGSTMKYTAGEWDTSFWQFDLESSQKIAMDMICQRAELSEWQRVLEVGFWYGTLAHHMIDKYEVEVTGLTVSDGQKNFAHNYLKVRWVHEKTNLLNLDWKELYTDSRYRDIFVTLFQGKFDRIVSIEMIEAVSTADLPLFSQFLFECLNDNGILFFQAINSDRKVYTTDAFIDKYIFPDWVVPQHQNLVETFWRAWFQQVEFNSDLLTQSYDSTLMQWYKNLEQFYPIFASELDFYYNNREKNPFPYKEIPSFLRIFEYYLKSCAWAFRSSYNRDGQYKFYKWKDKINKIISPTREEAKMILQNKF